MKIFRNICAPSIALCILMVNVSITLNGSFAKVIARMKLEIPKFKFKKDSYMRSRGTPAMLKISCSQCTMYIMSYQKDGPGPLKRCYLDRIHHPESLEQRQHEAFDKNSAPKLECSGCTVVIGTPMIYEKENRPAYHMIQGLFKRKKMY